jgi:hypothetical protein
MCGVQLQPDAPVEVENSRNNASPEAKFTSVAKSRALDWFLLDKPVGST